MFTYFAHMDEFVTRTPIFRPTSLWDETELRMLHAREVLQPVHEMLSHSSCQEDPVLEKVLAEIPQDILVEGVMSKTATYDAFLRLLRYVISCVDGLTVECSEKPWKTEIRTYWKGNVGFTVIDSCIRATDNITLDMEIPLVNIVTSSTNGPDAKQENMKLWPNIHAQELGKMCAVVGARRHDAMCRPKVRLTFTGTMYSFGIHFDKIYLKKLWCPPRWWGACLDWKLMPNSQQSVAVERSEQQYSMTNTNDIRALAIVIYALLKRLDEDYLVTEWPDMDMT